MLGVAWEGGDEFEVEFLHGCGGFDGIEMGVKGAEEDLGREGGFGENELAGVGGSVIESEGEVELGGGALVVVEAVAEGLEEALGHEEEGFVVGDRGLELMGDAVVVAGAVELEEAVVFTEGDIVEAGEVGTEALGEALAREFGEVGEGFEAPELEDLGVWEGEGFGEGEVGEI